MESGISRGFPQIGRGFGKKRKSLSISKGVCKIPRTGTGWKEFEFHPKENTGKINSLDVYEENLTAS